MGLLPSIPAALSAATDPLADVPSYGTALVRMVIALVVVVVLLVIALKVLQRVMRGRVATTSRTGALQVVDRIQLEPGRSLHLIRIGEQYLLVSSGEAGISLIADQSLDHAALRARLADAGRPATAADERRFAQVLGKVRSGAAAHAPVESTESGSPTQ